MSPAQIEARRKRLEAAAAKSDAPRCPSCNTPFDQPHPAECPWKPKPSAAFKEGLGKARNVVADYMSGKKARSFILRLPVPPSVNHSHGPRLDGGRYLMEEYKAFRAAVAFAVYGENSPKLYGRLRVYIRINAPRMDIDNPVKNLLDSLQRAGAIENDRNVDQLTVERSIMIPEGMLDVEVSEL
jgi:Holliday junction resolvase RusA-like endonuclease